MIISLAGKAKSGKDTVGEYLVQKHGFVSMAWADNLKEMCMKAFNLTHEQVYTQEGKESCLPYTLAMNENLLFQLIGWMEATSNYHYKPIPQKERNKILDLKFETPREILQLIGTEFCRALYSNYHIEVVQNRISKLPSGSKIVITDTRFPDELQASKDMGAVAIKVVRPGVEITQSSHASETSFNDDSDYHVILDNSGSLEDLYVNIENVVKPQTDLTF